MSNEYRKASDIISSLFDQFDTSGMKKAGEFIKNWKELVGEKIGTHSKVIDVDNGVVIVEVDHPGWSQQIQFRKKQILYGLSRVFPELKIKNIALRVVTECKTPYVKQNCEVGSGIPRMEEVQSDVEIPENMNPELKEILEKLKNSIKRGKSSGV